MQKYKYYKTVDFLSDDEFIDWVRAPNWETNLYWQEVFALFPAVKSYADEARQLVVHMRVKPMTGATTNLKEAIVAKALIQEVKGRGTSSKPLTIRHLSKWMVAALVLIVSGLLLVKIPLYKPTKLEVISVDDAHTKQVKNVSDMVLLVELPDQSTVILQPKAYMSYRADSFALKREVHLVGEAFFDISKNKQAPFIVNTDQLITKVLGTSFFVNASPNTAAHRVLVASGSVRVETKKNKSSTVRRQREGLVLHAGQETYLNADRPMTITLSEQALHITEDLEKAFDFQNVPMSKVAATLHEYYGLDVQIKKQELAKRPITAFLGNVSLQEKLNLIAKAVEARYQLDDGVVIFTLEINQQ